MLRLWFVCMLREARCATSLPPTLSPTFSCFFFSSFPTFVKHVFLNYPVCETIKKKNLCVYLGWRERWWGSHLCQKLICFRWSTKLGRELEDIYRWLWSTAGSPAFHPGGYCNILGKGSVNQYKHFLTQLKMYIELKTYSIKCRSYITIIMHFFYFFFFGKRGLDSYW